jgi:hypothetical protein
LQDVLRDPIFADIDLPALEVADLATSFPGISEALLRLYGAYTREQAALADLSAGGDRKPPTPWPRRGASFLAPQLVPLARRPRRGHCRPGG